MTKFNKQVSINYWLNGQYTKNWRCELSAEALSETRRPLEIDLEARARATIDEKVYEATLCLYLQFASMHTQCAACERTTMQHVAALGVELKEDSEAAISQASMAVDNSHSVLESHIVYLIKKVTVEEVYNAVGQEISEHSDVFRSIEEKALKLLEKTICDGCMLAVKL